MYVQEWQNERIVKQIAYYAKRRSDVNDFKALREAQATPNDSDNFLVSNIIKVLVATDADFQNVNISGVCLREFNLDGFRFRNADFSNAEFRDVNCLLPMSSLIGMALSHDGRILGVGDTNGIIYLFRTGSWRCVSRLAGPCPWTRSMQFVGSNANAPLKTTASTNPHE